MVNRNSIEGQTKDGMIAEVRLGGELEKEGTMIMSPYKSAIVKPLSAAEVLDNAS